MKEISVKWRWPFVLVGVALASVAQDSLPPPSPFEGETAVYRVEVYVFRIPVRVAEDGDGPMIDDEHALLKVDGGKLVPVLEPDENTSVCGPTIELSVRGLRWTADRKGLQLPDKEALHDSLVEVVARPSVLLPLGESAEIRIGEEQPVQYFEETEDDDVFALRTMHKFVGYTFGCTINRSEKTEGALSVKITSALEGIGDRRRSVPGLSLDVGQPTTTETRQNTTVPLRPEDWFGLVYRTWDRSSLVLTLLTIHEDGS